MTDTLGAQGQLAVNSPGRLPSSAQDIPRRIDETIRDFERGLLQKPPHQRDSGIWPIANQRDFLQNLAQSRVGKQGLGSFATYELVKDGQSTSPQFLNDGLQRVSTIQRAVADPSMYGLDKDGIESILRQSYTVQHRHYDDHLEAMKWFQRLNYGTQLTPYEHCQGYFAYLLPGFEQTWEPTLLSLGQAVVRAENQIGIKDTKASRETRHKRLRHDYALFWRFVSCDSQMSSYTDVTAGDIRDQIEKDDTTEQKLIQRLLVMGHSGALEEVEKFRTHIKNTTASMGKAIRDVRGPERTIDRTLFRWFLDVSIYRRNAKVPSTWFETFIRSVIKRTRGRARWERDDGSEVNLRLSYLEPLPMIAGSLGLEQPLARPIRGNADRLLKDGHDNSHYEPVSTHGDGETFPEPASINRARGAKPV